MLRLRWVFIILTSCSLATSSCISNFLIDVKDVKEQIKLMEGLTKSDFGRTKNRQLKKEFSELNLAIDTAIQNDTLQLSDAILIEKYRQSVVQIKLINKELIVKNIDFQEKIKRLKRLQIMIENGVGNKTDYHILVEKERKETNALVTAQKQYHTFMNQAEIAFPRLKTKYLSQAIL